VFRKTGHRLCEKKMRSSSANSNRPNTGTRMIPQHHTPRGYG
jgi:hypothetical protein